MNKSIMSIIIQGIKDCIKKYIIAIVISVVLLLISNSMSDPKQAIIRNICSALFALPIVFLCCDVYQLISTRKQRELVATQMNAKIETIFVNFVFMTNKFRKSFDSAIADSPDVFLDARNSNENQIFDDISSVNHNGFFVFSDFDDFCTGINDMLESRLFLTYASNEVISLLSEFSMVYHMFLEEFKVITKDDFIKIGSSEELELEESKNVVSEKTVYNVKKIIDGKTYVLYFTSYPIFDETMIKGIYRISGIKAKVLSKELFTLYSLILHWEHLNNYTISEDNIFVSAGRLVQNSHINFYAENNVSLNISWN